MNHKCKARERLTELQSPIGQAAYSYYAEWMKLNKRSVPPIERFSESDLYSTFIKFARHVNKVRLPKVSVFIRTMVQNNNITPSLWCRDNVHAMYMRSYDVDISPKQQFDDSLKEILDLSIELQVAPNMVFEALGVDAILDLTQKRKLSPWFLVASGAFRDWLRSREPNDQDRLEAGIQVGPMVARIHGNAKLQKYLTDFSQTTNAAGL